MFLEENSKMASAFSCGSRHLQFIRMPMGISGAVESFQRLMQQCLQGLDHEICLCYLDDCLVWSRSESEMIERLSQIFNRFRKHGLRMNPSKCIFGVESVLFLGHIFNKTGVHVNPEKIKIVQDYPVPRTPKQVKSFLGLASYYKRFIKQFSHITAPLRQLLQKNVKYDWSSDCQKAFDTLKNALISAPILVRPDFDKPFILTTDSSTTACAYILSQLDDKGREQVVSYGGRALRDNEKRWGVSEIEALAVIEGINEYHVYLASRPFLIVTDHSALTFINRMKLCSTGNNRLTRWALHLQNYQYEIVHKAGSKLLAADALSRMPRENDDCVNQAKSDTDQEHEELIAPITSSAATGERTSLTFELNDDYDDYCASVKTPTSDMPTLAEVKEAQASCPDFGPMHAYLVDGSLPSNDKAARKLILEAHDYVIEDGVLFHLFSPRTKRLDRALSVIKQVCVPFKFRRQVAYALHVGLVHPGFDRTYASCRSKYHWPGMYGYLKDYVMTCVDCQRCKRPAHKNQIPVGALKISPPLTSWTADFHGPYPESNGMKYVLVFICPTSGWIELIATKDTSAKTVVQCLHDQIICRYGTPRNLSLQTDCGSGFIASLTRLCCKTFGIRQIHSAPYHADPQARCESFADIIHKSLRLICDKQSEWTAHLQSIAYSYRATTTTNGLSPFEVCYGKSMALPIDISMGVPDELFQDSEAYATHIGPKIAILQQIAMQNATDSAAYQRQRVNKNAKLPSWNVGDKILLFNPVTKTGECKKFKVRYDPFLITEILPGNKYRLQCVDTGVDLKRPVHANRLRTFHLRDNDEDEPRSKLNPTVVFDGTIANKLKVKVILGDIVSTHADAIVCYENQDLLPIGECSDRIISHAGIDMVNDELNIAQLSIGMQLPSAILTNAGSIKTCNQVIHSLRGRNGTNSKTNTMDVLLLADESIRELAIPFFDFYDSDGQIWSIAQDLVEALLEFQNSNRTPQGCLSHITVVCHSLLQGDIMRVICNKLIVPQNDVTTSSAANESAVTPTNEQQQQQQQLDSSEWYTVKEVLKRRRMRNGKYEYLVVWEDLSKSWVPRPNLTDTAVQIFLAKQNEKRKRRRKQ